MSYTNGLDNPELYFQVKTYAGNNSGSGQAITFDGSENMQPDLVWVKCRDVGHAHTIYDSVRTSPAKNFLKSDDNIAERTVALGSFDSNGVTFTNNDGFNNGSGNYVIWNWKAGTSFTNDASSTGIGTIDSVGSVSDTAGVSIVTWTGTGSAGTIKHGLSTAPSTIITFCRSTGYHHSTFHHKNTSAPETDVVYLNLTNATADDSGFWNDTLPTTSVFSVGTDNSVNQSSQTYVAYCFSERQGYFKAGSYTGNGSSDGSYVFLGFKSAWLMVKRTDSTSDWVMLDNKRDSFNLMNKKLFSNNSDSEYSGQNACDFLSNGFKLRDNATNNFATNISGSTYIYMAFAESPFVNSKGVPTNAR